MILLIDTTKDHHGKQLVTMLEASEHAGDCEYIDTENMNISPCLGCNHCWLKTPGRCPIKDDYEPILKKMHAADQVWLITDTKFGFVSYKTKNIIDRIMPLVTMYLHFQGNQMRHVMRYDNNPDFGVIYMGEANKKYLTWWCERVALNCGTRGLGAYPADQMKEAIACM